MAQMAAAAAVAAAATPHCPLSRAVSYHCWRHTNAYYADYAYHAYYAYYACYAYYAFPIGFIHIIIIIIIMMMIIIMHNILFHLLTPRRKYGSESLRSYRPYD